MPFIPPGFCNVQLLFTSPTQRPALTACGFEALALAPEDVFAASARVGTSNIVDQLANGWTYNGMRVVIGTSDPSEPVTFESGNGATTPANGAAMVASASILVTKVTLRGGRKGRGRMFIPGVREGLLDDASNLGSNLAGYQANVDLLMEDIGEDLNSARPFLLHEDPAEDPDEITDFRVAALAATQRRRMRA